MQYNNDNTVILDDVKDHILLCSEQLHTQITTLLLLKEAVTFLWHYGKLQHGAGWQSDQHCA